MEHLLYQELWDFRIILQSEFWIFNYCGGQIFFLFFFLHFLEANFLVFLGTKHEFLEILEIISRGF